MKILEPDVFVHLLKIIIIIQGFSLGKVAIQIKYIKSIYKFQDIIEKTKDNTTYTRLM